MYPRREEGFRVSPESIWKWSGAGPERRTHGLRRLRESERRMPARRGAEGRKRWRASLHSPMRGVRTRKKRERGGRKRERERAWNGGARFQGAAHFSPDQPLRLRLHATAKRDPPHRGRTSSTPSSWREAPPRVVPVRALDFAAATTARRFAGCPPAKGHLSASSHV